MTASLPLSATMAISTLHLLTFLPSLGAASGKQPAANGTSAAAAADSTNGKAAAPGALPPLRNGSVPAGAPAAGFAPAPAVDLALYDSLAAVVDHGSHIFVWVHPELSAAEWAAAESACRGFALRLGAGRMPVPEVRRRVVGGGGGSGGNTGAPWRAGLLPVLAHLANKVGRMRRAAAPASDTPAHPDVHMPPEHITGNQTPALLLASWHQVVVDARQCLARLTPIQGDSYAQQLAQAPLLAAAHRGLLERAARQLGPAAEPSLYQWLEQNGLRPE